MFGVTNQDVKRWEFVPKYILREDSKQPNTSRTILERIIWTIFYLFSIAWFFPRVKGSPKCLLGTLASLIVSVLFLFVYDPQGSFWYQLPLFPLTNQSVPFEMQWRLCQTFRGHAPSESRSRSRWVVVVVFYLPTYHGWARGSFKRALGVLFLPSCRTTRESLENNGRQSVESNLRMWSFGAIGSL